MYAGNISDPTEKSIEKYKNYLSISVIKKVSTVEVNNTFSFEHITADNIITQNEMLRY